MTQEDRLEINQWLMAQMGYVGPMLGQHHQFHHYNPGKSKFGEERYFKISKRIYEELDEDYQNQNFYLEKIIQLLILELFHGLLDMNGMTLD